MRREKLLIIIAFLFGAFITRDVDGASIVKYENEPNTGNGIYKFAYETSDGTSRSEHSEIKTDKDNNEYIIVIGEFQYVDPNGVLHSVTYTADENGYRQTDKVDKEDKVEVYSAGFSPSLTSDALGSLIGGGLG